MKASCLAIAFLLGSLPVVADELPQTSNAWRATDTALAQPGSFHWTVVDEAAGATPQTANGLNTRGTDAPARAALAQIRRETARLLDEARRSSVKVARIRYDLRVRCIVEQIASEPDSLANVALPWIWGAPSEDGAASDTVEMCEVDYSQKVRSEVEPEPQMRDYTVSLPIE